MSHLISGIFKWSIVKFLSWIVILAILVLFHYANLFIHDDSAQIIKELTNSKAEQEKIIALMADETQKEYLNNKILLKTAERTKQECYKNYQNAADQTRGVMWVKHFVAKRSKYYQSPLERALAEYQVACGAYDKAKNADAITSANLEKESLNRRKKVASAKDQEELKAAEQVLKERYDYSKQCQSEYFARFYKGYKVDAKKYNKAKHNYLIQKRMVSRIRQNIGRKEINETKEKLQLLSERIHELEDRVKGPTYDSKKIIFAHTSQASWILLAVILTPIVIKAFLYFLVAPLTSRFPAISLNPEKNETSARLTSQSSTSVNLEVTADQEALIKASFLQSGNQKAKRSTRWLLNYSIPFSSIASGMYLLTRVRSNSEAPIDIVVSSQKTPLDKVGVLTIPEGASMVIKPHAIVGVIIPKDSSIKITRHWRLFSLQAWLTLQLRYLVFHGECQLILRGCRGMKAESPMANNPRMINQSATMGFCTDLAYKNTRCETFVSYLRGEENLFNDMFIGEEGIYVYEEVPSQLLKGGLTGRGIEGFIDVLLKVVGI